MRIDKEGVLPDFPLDAYFNDPCPEPSLSSTVARLLIGQSPLHAWTAHPRLNPDYQQKVSDAFDIGNVAHRMLLGKGADFEIVDAPDWTRKATREERDAIRETGRVPILSGQHERAEAMQLIASRALRDFGIEIATMQTEVTVVARIETVWCRALLDLWDGVTIYDYKTCANAAPDACIRAAASYGYDVQAAWYCSVFEAVTGRWPRFRFIFQEKEPPHEVSVVELVDDLADEADWMAGAREKCAEARRLWRRCLDRDEWPGYPRLVALLGAPAWHTAAWRSRPTAKDPTPDDLKASAEWQAPIMEDANV